MRQLASCHEDGAKMPAKTPVAPMTRPMANISKTADSPIKAPPKAEVSGVNAVSIMRAPHR